MTATEIRQKGLDLVTGIPVRELSIPVRVELVQALATLEVAAQLAELNERLATSLTSGPGAMTALRIYEMK